MKKIKSVTWKCLGSINFPAEKMTTGELIIPGYFPMISDKSMITWDCLGCNKEVTLQWPNTDKENIEVMKVPSTKYYNLILLQQIASAFDNFKVLNNLDLHYITDLQTKISPSLILAKCSHCSHYHALSYAIGIGQESRPPKPNTFAIKRIELLSNVDLIAYSL